ncbi:MAG: hypothetical protein GY874_18530 [Desulfobacteraceae bacterium]|nr:hypothetical protein [Desulfobacteraceae bacterium]
MKTKETMKIKKVDLNITLKELQLLWEILYDKISKLEKKDINLEDMDMYWSVGAPECYDMSKEPALIVGSLKDDLDEVKKLLKNKDRPATFVDLDRFSAILNAISQKLNPL